MEFKHYHKEHDGYLLKNTIPQKAPGIARWIILISVIFLIYVLVSIILHPSDPERTNSVRYLSLLVTVAGLISIILLSIQPPKVRILPSGRIVVIQRFSASKKLSFDQFRSFYKMPVSIFKNSDNNWKLTACFDGRDKTEIIELGQGNTNLIKEIVQETNELFHQIEAEPLPVQEEARETTSETAVSFPDVKTIMEKMAEAIYWMVKRHKTKEEEFV